MMHYTFSFNIRLYTTAFIFSSSIFYLCAFLEDDLTSYTYYTYFQVFTHIDPQQITNVEVVSCIYFRTYYMSYGIGIQFINTWWWSLWWWWLHVSFFCLCRMHVCSL